MVCLPRACVLWRTEDAQTTLYMSRNSYMWLARVVSFIYPCLHPAGSALAGVCDEKRLLLLLGNFKKRPNYVPVCRFFSLLVRNMYESSYLVQQEYLEGRRTYSYPGIHPQRYRSMCPARIWDP